MLPIFNQAEFSIFFSTSNLELLVSVAVFHNNSTELFLTEAVKFVNSTGTTPGFSSAPISGGLSLVSPSISVDIPLTAIPFPITGEVF